MSREDVIKKYMNKFGWFPYFLLMGADDEKIIEAVQNALNTGVEIKPMSEDAIY